MKKLKDYLFYENELGRIYHGDNLKVMPLLEEKIDVIYTDPPYFFNTGSRCRGFYRRPGRKTLMEKLDESFGHHFDPDRFLESVIKLAARGLPVNCYIWTNKSLIPRYLNWALENKLTYNLLTWHKNNRPPLTKNNFLPDTEYLLFFRSKGAYFNSHLSINHYRKWWVTNVTTLTPYDHPTVKPLEITFGPLKISCPGDGIICDPFLGSGTTAVAAERLGRKWVGIEISKRFCRTAKKRIEHEHTQLKTERSI